MSLNGQPEIDLSRAGGLGSIDSFPIVGGEVDCFDTDDRGTGLLVRHDAYLAPRSVIVSILEGRINFTGPSGRYDRQTRRNSFVPVEMQATPLVTGRHHFLCPVGPIADPHRWVPPVDVTWRQQAGQSPSFTVTIDGVPLEEGSLRRLVSFFTPEDRIVGIDMECVVGGGYHHTHEVHYRHQENRPEFNPDWRGDGDPVDEAAVSTPYYTNRVYSFSIKSGRLVRALATRQLVEPYQ
ncbi:MAG TPA: hypothetical protein VED40_20090 [Azospirillaceae bacterium]|nr:hypothetical protein [Azospirillaceae bacterium]